MSTLANLTMTSYGASLPCTRWRLRGMIIMPPSETPNDLRMNSGRPPREFSSRSVPGMPHCRSAPKFIHEVTYMSIPNRKARPSSVSVIVSTDLKNSRCWETHSLSTFVIVCRINSTVRMIVSSVTLNHLPLDMAGRQVMQKFKLTFLHERSLQLWLIP